MISVSRARKILGKAAEGLDDENMELLISQMYALAEVMYEHFEGDNEVKFDKNCRKSKLKLESQ